MEVLKGFGKFLLTIITFILSIFLTVTIVLYSIRSMSSHYFEKETINEMINTIDITDLFLDSNGNEIKQITEIKNELVSAGIPVELTEDFLNSKPVKEATTNIIELGIDYVIYDKEIEKTNISSDDIYNFFEVNIPMVVSELQEKNIPKSELLTKENQQLILEQLKEKIPVIEEKVNEVLEPAIEELKNTDEYKQLDSYKNKTLRIIDIIQFIYSDTITLILISFIIGCMIMIMISRLSFYKGFKWIGFSFLLSGVILCLIGIFVPIIRTGITDIPYVFRNFVTYMLDDIVHICMYDGILYFIIAGILIIVNIIIYLILEKREDKKFEI